MLLLCLVALGLYAWPANSETIGMTLVIAGIVTFAMAREFARRIAMARLEMGEALLLGGQKIEPSKLISSGYPFRYRDLRASLEALLRS